MPRASSCLCEHVLGLGSVVSIEIEFSAVHEDVAIRGPPFIGNGGRNVEMSRI